MNRFYLIVAFVFIALGLKAQNPPCSDASILERHQNISSQAEAEQQANEAFIDAFIEKLKENRANGTDKITNNTYVIPVVIHVFHDGDTAKLDMAQIQSGLDILNNDMKGLNADFNTVIPRFDSIKATLDIQFCLATIDPDGNPTTGVLYYDDSLAMTNTSNLFVHAWDNYKYMNFYLPRYTGGSWSLFTAYAYYPSTVGSNFNQGGVFYSSIRWGYGNHSELAPGQEWASVVTHEVGHWLDLRHTFENGCTGQGDGVADTPPTTGGNIFLSGCDNNDMTCGEKTNGSNYMDYNHDCKKMFTQGQVDRMIAALYLPSRITLWSDSNLVATGCKQPISLFENERKTPAFTVYPNPAKGVITVSTKHSDTFVLTDLSGRQVLSGTTNTPTQLGVLRSGVYLIRVGHQAQKLVLQPD